MGNHSFSNKIKPLYICPQSETKNIKIQKSSQDTNVTFNLNGYCFTHNLKSIKDLIELEKQISNVIEPLEGIPANRQFRLKLSRKRSSSSDFAKIFSSLDELIIYSKENVVNIIILPQN